MYISYMCPARGNATFGPVCSMPDVTADNLTLDGATDGLPADAATDSTAEESTCNSKSSSKQKSSGTATTFNVKRSKHSADDEIDVNR